jgi:phosphomannomutase
MITINPGKVYIFDVDGTLTIPRQKMNDNMLYHFKDWCRDKNVFLATGSDVDKLKEQIPEDLISLTKGVFCCMGNHLLSNKLKNLYKVNFPFHESLKQDLTNFINNSKYKDKTGNHIEERIGMLNFSTVGRNADKFQRNEYNKWDEVQNERKEIAEYINKNYPGLSATVGGSISIDIIPIGRDKGQIIKFLLGLELDISEIHFVGDRTYKGGNDYGIRRELMKTNIPNRIYQVRYYTDTFDLFYYNKLNILVDTEW